jgi:uncharacterized protein (TIGR03437 family)
MKNRIRSVALKSLAILAAAVLGATCAWTYTLQYQLFPTGTGAGGYFCKWAGSSTVTMAYNLTMPSVSSSITNPSLVQAVLKNDMLNVWNGILKANTVPVQFADGGTSTLTAPACDGVNLITFVNASASAPPPPNGVLAFTYVFATSQAGLLPAGTCGPNDITTTFVGQIIDADITFNTTQAFSIDGRYIGGSANNQAADLEGTALHEMGHVLGLHHSTLNSALMVPAAQQGFPNRSLNSDDIAGINAAYGVNTLGGSISGKITDNASTPNPIFGAIVQLTNTVTGVPTVAGITDSTGAYSMVGFAQGTYRISVKPIDAPFLPGNYTPQYNTAPAAAFNALLRASPVSVTGTANVAMGPIQVTPTHTATFSTAQVGTTYTISLPNGAVQTAFAAVGGVVTSARRAGNPASAYPANLGVTTGAYTLCVGGIGLTADISTSVPTAQATGSTITTNNCSAPLARNFTFPFTTVPGWYDVYTGNDLLPSSLSITTNPLVGAGGVVDSAANTTTYAAGAFISIYGLDLATQTVPNTVFPVATQLGGVSVRVGDRFAPLFFVSPGQINAMIPYEATACSTGATTGCLVDVQVQVGTNSIYDYGNINVVASAPKIFTINATGTGQGAIQDGSAPNCPACPIADGKNYTASAGDILVIYASGLGQTTPAAIDGLSGSGTVPLPTVAFTANGKTIVQSQQNGGVVYAGATSCCSALYQVNVALPAGLGVSNAAQVTITTTPGNTSNTVTVAVK